ncbi:MAG: chemotaxis protein CheC [Lachnospiraceae bacterium]|nr:chemotaxis protein CheC [Lachnospiraceae bacterium]
MSNQESFEQLNDLNNMRYDVLREIGNIGAGNATTALSQLINSRVDMTVPKVDLLNFQELADVVGSAEDIVVGILFNLSGDIQGMMMFMMEYTAAHHLVNCLTGKEKENMEAFTEFDLSALKEIGNIISGAYLSALSTLINLNIKESIPYMSVDMAGAVLSVPAIAFGELGDKALLIQSEFNQTDKSVSGFFILIPTEESYGKIMSSLGVQVI